MNRSMGKTQKAKQLDKPLTFWLCINNWKKLESQTPKTEYLLNILLELV